MNAPCFMCEKRSATCHSTCEDYKDYAAGRAEACHNKKADVRAVGYFIDQCRKRRRKWVKRVYK